MKNRLLIFFLLLFWNSFSQNPGPAESQQKSILIMGGIAHLGNGKVIENSAIGFKAGRLSLVADATLIKLSQGAYDSVINVQGKHIYPGFIAMNTTIGLSEIELVRATNDFNETGRSNPSSRAIIAYNTDSKVTPTVRSNGVLLAQIVPQGGLISGSSSVVELDAWNWEDAVYKMDEGIHLNWPDMRIYRGGEEIDKQQDQMNKNLRQINDLFNDALAYSKTNDHEKANLNFEAMKGLFNRSKKLYVHCNFEKEIIAAVNFCKKYNVQMVLTGGRDAWKTITILKENNIPVIIQRTHAVPYREDEDVNEPYKMAAQLIHAGIPCCISVDGFWQVRNLGFNAGTASAWGLTKEDALKTITSVPAAILNIDKITGTLEEGKDATLFISEGDALDMLGNNVVMAFIRGKQINLDDIQKQLYHKYMKKYKLE